MPGRSKAMAGQRSSLQGGQYNPARVRDRSALSDSDGPLLHAVVGRFLRDRHVVDVAFAYSSRRDANDLGLALQFRNRRASAVAHASAQTAHQLMDDGGGGPFVRDPAFD